MNELVLIFGIHSDSTLIELIPLNSQELPVEQMLEVEVVHSGDIFDGNLGRFGNYTIISANFQVFFTDFTRIRKILTKFNSRKFTEIPTNFHQNRREKLMILTEIYEKNRENLQKKLQNFTNF